MLPNNKKVKLGSVAKAGHEINEKLRADKKALKGVNFAGKKLGGIYADRSDWSGANLKGTTIVDSSFVSTNLSYINGEGLNAAVQMSFSGANFTNANLKNAKLVEQGLGICDFSNADLTNADLHDSQMHYAKFTGTILNKTNFANTELFEADFSKAKIIDCSFEKAKYSPKTKWPGEPPKGTILIKKPNL